MSATNQDNPVTKSVMWPINKSMRRSAWFSIRDRTEGAIDIPADAKIDPSIKFLAVIMDCAKLQPIKSVDRGPLDDHKFNQSASERFCYILLASTMFKSRWNLMSPKAIAVKMRLSWQTRSGLWSYWKEYLV